MAQRRGLIWADAQGENVLHVLTTSTSSAGLANALNNHSNAVVQQEWSGTNGTSGLTPTVDTYPTVRITARLFYRESTGSIATLYIPAPQQAIFLADGVTVDPTMITDITAQAIGNLLCGNSIPATEFVGGELWQQKITGIASLQAFTP